MAEDPKQGPEQNNLVVIGGSAGAIEPLCQVLSNLPPDLPAAVLVVIHMQPTGNSVLPQILSRKSGWPVLAAVDGEEVQPGRAYVAVPNHHLLVDASLHLRVVKGPKENGHRPAVDPLFRSAANAGASVVGVVLSGGLDDGAAGAAMIRRHGGLVLTQDREQASVSDMPRHAMDAAGVDAELPAAELGRWITQRLRNGPIPERSAPPPAADLGAIDLPATVASDLVCPDCGGVMRQVADGSVLRFRCHVGHGWTASALRARQDDQFDEALWTALRTVDDQIAVDERLLERSRDAGRESAVRLIQDRLAAEEDASRALWQLLTGGIGDRAAGSRTGPRRADEIAAWGNRLN